MTMRYFPSSESVSIDDVTDSVRALRDRPVPTMADDRPPEVLTPALMQEVGAFLLQQKSKLPEERLTPAEQAHLTELTRALFESEKQR